jgi:glutathione S-transferase
MTYVLHFAPDNASVIIRFALEALNQPYRVVLVDRDNGGLQAPAYLALNPHGLIPVLETPDGPLFETGAILLWLADRHGGLAPAPGDRDRGLVLKWLFWMANTLHAAERHLFYPDRIAPPGQALEVQRIIGDQIAEMVTLLQDVLPELDGWVGGPGLSVLDCYLAALLRWPAIYGQGANPGGFRLSDWPALCAVMARVETHPAIQAVARIEGLGDRPVTAPVNPEE